MDSIRTYSVGNGEITLTAHDAEELRIILQTEHMENVVNEIIDADPSVYRFYSDKARSAFVSNIVSRYSDLRDVEYCFAEVMEDAMLQYAEDLGIRG